MPEREFQPHFTAKSDLQGTIFSLTSAEDGDKHRVKLGLIHTYRNLGSVSRKSKMKNVSVPELKYFKANQKRKLRPETTIFTRPNSYTSLNFEQFGYGDSYAAAVSIAMSHRPELETINFRNNRLHESGVLKILETIEFGTHLKELDLSENQLGVKSVEKLASMLQSNCSIQKLSLEKCLPNKQLVNSILLSASRNIRLTTLNLSRNAITASSAKELRTLLDGNITLKVLDLHWNSLRGAGAVELLKGLAKNNTLEALDASWNALGRDENMEVIKALEKVFGENTSLLHLDLSNNYFTLEECTLLADSLNCNHTILGLHMDGNDCSVDSKGFLIPVKDKRKDIDGHLSHRLFGKRRNHGDGGTCWLCDRWQAVTFEWSMESVQWNRRLMNIAGEQKKSIQPVFLHLEVDDYQPELMDSDDYGTYRVTRAVPSSGAKFFFSYRGYAHVSNIYSVFSPAESMHKEVTFFDNVKKELLIVVLNFVPGFGPICTGDGEFPISPRPIHWVYRGDPVDFQPIIQEWSIKTSIFKQYRLDSEVPPTQELMKECLDYDWTHSRLSGIIKSAQDQQTAKDSLLPVYKDL